MSPRPRTRRLPQQVSAVLVCHDGARWLPHVLAGLAGLTRRPDRLVAVDTGSSDGTGALLAEALGDEAVIDLPGHGFGASVRVALAGLPEPVDPSNEWIWLLHDDAVPEPDALAALLELAANRPDAAVLGPKVRTWNGRYLLEVGVSTDRTGRRDPGTERRELDQGQRDAVREVLAVGSAGCLIRRDVWDALGGYDPDLRLFGDDLDFGWRVSRAGWRVLVAPAAVVRHAAALSTGRREAAGIGAPRRLARRGAVYPLLANSPGWSLPLLAARLAFATLLRTLGLLLARQPRAAWDELVTVVSLFAHPARLIRARRVRKAAAREPARALRPLLAGPGPRLRAYRDALGVVLGLVTPEPGAGSALARWRRRAGPAAVLVAALLAVAVLAERGLVGSAVAGGRLLPAPPGAGAAWQSYLAAFHDVGLGSGAAAPPLLAIVAALGTLTLGKPWVVVDLLLLGCVPLGGLTAFLAARRVVRSRLLAAWAAGTWALLPVATGAISGGRLGAAVAVIALPPLGLGMVRLVYTDPAERGWWRAFAVGAGIAVAAAFAPQVFLAALLGWVLLLLARLTGAPARPRPGWPERLRGAAAGALALAVAPLLLFPWSWRVATHLPLLLAGPGLPVAASGPVPAHALLLADPGGPGTPPAWIFAPLLVAAAAGVLARRGPALLAWVFALAGYAGALALARSTVVVGGVAYRPWPGVAALATAAAVLAAVLLAADGARQRLAALPFGWRQLLATVLTACAAVVPLGFAAAWLLGGAAGPLRPATAAHTPAFLAAEAAGTSRRVLVLTVPRSGPVRYAVLPSGVAPTLGGDSSEATTADPALGPAISRLVSGTGAPVLPALLAADIGYLRLGGPGAPAAEAHLEAVAGLVRLAGTGTWALGVPAARLGVLVPGATLAAPLGPAWAARVPPGPPGRLLVVSAARSAGWRASLNGRRLEPAVAYGWAQAFRLPAAGGAVRVSYPNRARDVDLLVQLALLVLVVVLARPARPPRPELVAEEPAPVAVAVGGR